MTNVGTYAGQKRKNLKYVHFLTRTNVAAQLKNFSFRSATTPAAAAATPTIVDVHWPDDAAVNALCLHEQHEKYLKNIKHIVWQTLFLCLCPMSLTSLWLCPFMSFRIAWYTVRLNDTVLEILGKQVNFIKLGVVSFTNPLDAGSQVRRGTCL